MANHLHKQIRDALVTALTGLATTGSRVFANRLRPMQDTDLPGLRIYLDDEQAETLTVDSPYVQQRTLTASVEACAKVAIGLDDTLDLISKEVEIALSAGLTIGSRTLDVFYTGMRFDEEQLDKPVGVKRMQFSILFRAMHNAPDALI
ncbi:MAG: hypothetical protein B6D36_00160 [Planctomycetes bacterium UTPLA1]|nr:MAG: hypothetical protein B6D36_00160 [Planctomycetes bacterium UTPLA1]